MNQVVLQPTGNKDAREHYENTIQSPVNIKRFEKFLKADEFKALNKIYPSGDVTVWGVTPGKNDVNGGKYNKMKVGDITLFAANKTIFAKATTTLMLHNRKLAKDLWGVDANGRTWEYIYFVDEIEDIKIPYINFNEIAGYQSNFIIQGFAVLNETKSQAILDSFGLGSDTYGEGVSEEDLAKQSNKFKDAASLDNQSTTTVRLEQGLLRKNLFQGKKTEKCSICGKTLPVNLLVAAHIKKRSICDNEERLDFKHIATPMCKFGCDDLYEKGYIYVEEGTILINEKKYITDDLKETLHKLDNKDCIGWTEGNAKYFKAHKEYHGIK